MRPRTLLQKQQSGTTSREVKRYQTKGRANSADPNSHWYDQAEGKAHEDIFQMVRSIKTRQVRRRYEQAIFQQLYCNNVQNIWASSGLFSSLATNMISAYNRLSTNVVKSCIDTAVARIAASNPRGFILPKKGSYRLKRKARKLQKFLDGSMKSSGAYCHSEQVFRDAGIYGSGALYVGPKDGAVHSEVVKVDELIIDQVDGMYDDPQECSWEHPMARTELLARYGKDAEKAKAIEQARMSWRGDMAFMSSKDLVMVIRTWRKPSIRGGSDGRYVMAITGCTLEDKPWKYDYLPIFRFHWTPPTYGPFGMGITLELEGMQSLITNIMRDIGESIHKFAVPRVWLETLSGVSQHAITNELSVNKYSGREPIFSTPQAMAADVYQYLQWTIDQCYKQIGISQLDAQSEKPMGLDSGVAIRTYRDIGTQRQRKIGERWEAFFMAVSCAHIDCAADLYKDGATIAVNVPGRGFIESVSWSDASLEKDMYDIEIWPTNWLPETPQGKLSTVQELINSGFMPRDVALAQLRMPILSDWISEETAARDNIEMCLDAILEDGKYIEPDPISNIQLAVSLSQSEYLRAQADGDVEPRKVELLLRWMTRALEIAQAAAAAAAPPPGPLGPPGPGPGGPPPGGGIVGKAPAPPPGPLAPANGAPVNAPPIAA